MQSGASQASRKTRLSGKRSAVRVLKAAEQDAEQIHDHAQPQKAPEQQKQYAGAVFPGVKAVYAEMPEKQTQKKCDPLFAV